ncbi:MAG: IPT/TIG domain-containing protein [Xanthobacteraceae bacterium]
MVRFPSVAFALVMLMLVPEIAPAEPSSAAPPAPVIYAISPNPASAGAELAITGFGYTDRNTVMLGTTAVADVPIASAIGIACVEGRSECHPGINQTLRVRVPADAATGSYTVTVQNANGASKGMTLTVVPAAPR